MERAATFFDKAEEERITNAIRRVETRTAGEVAVMVVDESDPYPEAGLRAGILVGGLLALLVTDLWFDDSLWVFLPVAAALAGAVGWLAARVPEVKRCFLTPERMETAVRERAVRAFYEKGLYQTRDRTGVLFFLSLLEHRVWVLADTGIYQRIEQETLNEYAKRVAQGIKEDRAADALCLEIERVGRILAEHFPIRPGDENELPDQVLHQ